MSDPLLLFLGLNVALTFAIVLVLMLRTPVRRLFGARIAYGLWSLVPLAALAMLAPGRVVRLPAPPPTAAASSAGEVLPVAAHAAQQAPDFAPIVLLVWLAGVAGSFAWLAWRQAQFAQAVREGRGGPAVIGVVRPRVVTPADFGQRYTPREQQVVLAHEQTHIVRHDSRINALAALVRCLNWFNPAVHILAHVLRIDQELACDAQVVAAYPQARRTYAEAMLKTQLAARPLPLGCYWPAQAVHPLAQRVALLGRKAPGRPRRLAGVALIALTGLVSAWTLWLARPAHIVLETVEAPGPAAPLQVAAAAEPAPPPAPHRAPSPATPEAPSQPEAPTPAPEPVVERVADPLPPPIEVRRIRAAALRSAVEPGSAVRLLATMTDPDGVQLVTDLTAYGSQSAFRTGYFRRNGSRHQLFTSVTQHGDRLWVTASLDNRFLPERTATIELAQGQAGTIVLPNGQAVSVTASVRAETPQEVAEAEWAMARYANFRGPALELRRPLRPQPPEA